MRSIGIVFRRPRSAILAWARRLCRYYVRYAPGRIGKRFMVGLIFRSQWSIPNVPASCRTTQFGVRMQCDPSDLIQAYIYVFGVWEPHVSMFVHRRLSQGDVFVDIGANVGYYSLLASRLVGPSGSVVAIEASAEIFQMLLGNLELNRTRNVRPVNLAVSSDRRRLQVERGPSSNLGRTSVSSVNGQHPQALVDAAPPGEILLPQEVAAARLIKVDVEGAEWDVLPGLKELLARFRSDVEILVELNPRSPEAHGRSPEDLLRPFHEAGFHAYTLENEYAPESYVDAIPRPPRRLRTPIGKQVDLVLSRLDAEVL